VSFDTTLVPDALLALDLEAVAGEFGTPLFLYDEDELRRRCREYVDAFGEGNVAFAGKAFLCTAMARLVGEEGLHLDCATGGELHVALQAGFPAERIVLHGNNKSDEELVAALDAGVGRIVVDSFGEIARLGPMATARNVRPRVLVRVTPGVEAHTHEYIETGTERSKFGFSVTEGVAERAVQAVVEQPSLDFVGLHSHIGSQITVLEAYAKAADVVLGLAARLGEQGIVVSELNCGGGLGARYLASDPVIEVADYATALGAAVQRVAHGYGIKVPALMVEPGRSIAGPAAITLYRVGEVKTVPGHGRYVAVDGGMTDNPRPVLYGAGYEAFLPRALTDDHTEPAVVVGKHCEQGDIIVTEAQLPADVHPGDLLATPCTGAYGFSMASNYNKVPRPAVVWVSGGRPRVVVRREELADLTRLDV